MEPLIFSSDILILLNSCILILLNVFFLVFIIMCYVEVTFQKLHFFYQCFAGYHYQPSQSVRNSHLNVNQD